MFHWETSLEGWKGLVCKGFPNGNFLKVLNTRFKGTSLGGGNLLWLEKTWAWFGLGKRGKGFEGIWEEDQVQLNLGLELLKTFPG